MAGLSVAQRQSRSRIREGAVRIPSSVPFVLISSITTRNYISDGTIQKVIPTK